MPPHAIVAGPRFIINTKCAAFLPHREFGESEGRNDGLNDAGFTLRQFIADGLLTSRGRRKLVCIDGALANGDVANDGEAAGVCNDTQWLG